MFSRFEAENPEGSGFLREALVILGRAVLPGEFSISRSFVYPGITYNYIIVFLAAMYGTAKNVSR